MRISDWSSDVCSSDLIGRGRAGDAGELPRDGRRRVHFDPRGREAAVERRWFDELDRRGRIERGGGRWLGLSSHYSAQRLARRSEEHTSELQSLMRISYAVFCLKKKKNNRTTQETTIHTT